jgi:hypothetical protein
MRHLPTPAPVSVRAAAERLRKVARRLETRVVALHVEGGALFLNWSRRPGTAEIAAIASVWRRCSHYVCGAAFLLDAPGQRNPFRAGENSPR